MKSIKYYNIDTLTDLYAVKFSGDSTDSTYFTYSNTTPQSGTPDIPWHSVCSVSSVNQIYSHGKFYFPGKSGYSGTVYGVQWNTTDPNPDCTRIGNMSLHATLPIQSKIVGGLMLDDGTFNEFENQSDWTSYTRDGSLGQVMVRIPTFWVKFETWGDIYRVLMSSEPVIGFKKVKEMYCSAYEASLDRTNLKLSSVVNNTAQYRGGNNNSDWDSEDTAGNGGESHRRLLGRPATNISLTDFRTYARNRGSSAWNCYFYLMHKILYWLFVTEYATLNSQKAFNASLDSNGFHQGGLGDGVSTWDGTSWNNFNGYYPLVPCGWTDNIGNGSGVRDYTVHDAAGVVLKTFSVPRYRGIENPWGHIWQHTDGILCQVNSGADGVSQVYVTDDPTEFSSTSYSAYRFVGNELRVQQYVSQLHFGADGDITAKSGGGNSTSYYCDYHYCNVESTGLRAVLFGGPAHNGAYCGFVCSRSHHTPSFTNAYAGSRLCYFDAWSEIYEEYEVLKCDGTAYIDTLATVSNSTGIDIVAKKTTANNSDSYVCGTTYASKYFGVGVNHWQHNNDGYIRIGYGNTVSEFYDTSVVVHLSKFEIKINVNNSHIVELNGNHISLYDTLLQQNTEIINRTILIGRFNGFGSFTWMGNIYSCKLYDGLEIIHNLVPCKLLCPIPATMDANNTARPAGECGMWDKISNKFYGNVNSSGSFTVLNS